jgi:hypothetical protein
MEKSGVERKISHAANGRKAAIHRITKKGRARLAGADAGVLGGTAGVDSGESGPLPASHAGDEGVSIPALSGQYSAATVGVATPDQLHIGDGETAKVPVSASCAFNPENDWA